MFSRSLIACAVVVAITNTAAFVSQPAFTLSSRARSTVRFMNSDAAEERDTSEELQTGFSDSRRERLHLEASAKSRFVSGDNLHLLRKEVLKLRDELAKARRKESSLRVKELERAILKAQQVDAEFVYAVAQERMDEAEQIGNFEAVEKYRAEAMEARSCLPQFNLEGLWVGKYGDHGYEMINVTYVGDTLIAHKVTGAKNVPKGQTTFQVDLSPNPISSDDTLQPIELTDDATKQWGTKHLSRFVGVGQVSGEDFSNSQWLEGQLILVGDYFSFAWVPLGHQVFFGRPSPELILKMVKSEATAPSSQDQMRDYLERCLEETTQQEEEAKHCEKLSFSREDTSYFGQAGCFE